MKTQNTESDYVDENRSTQADPNSKIWSSCGGPEMFEADQIMRNCPCASLFKGSKKSFVIPLTAAVLLFSITLTGWILGVVAFFRTI